MNRRAREKIAAEVEQKGTEVPKRSYDLTQRNICYSCIENGTYEVYIKDAYVDPQNPDRCCIELQFNQHEFFKTYIHPKNMLWEQGWHVFFEEHDIKNIDELPGMKVAITVENNEQNDSVFSNITAVALQSEAKLEETIGIEAENAYESDRVPAE